MDTPHEQAADIDANVVIIGALLANTLLATCAAACLAACTVLLVSYQQPVVAVHATAEENPWAFERQTNTGGRDVFERCRDEAFCPVAPDAPALVNTTPEE